jgi:hypothetical protein
MSVISNNDGNPVGWKQKLTTTADQTIAVTASQDVSFRLDSVIAAADGSGGDFFLWVLDKDGNSIYLVNGQVLAPKTSLQVVNHPLPLKPGETFKCKTITGANHIDVTAVLVQITPKKNDTPMASASPSK